jgi:hypothetical protein
MPLESGLAFIGGRPLLAPARLADLLEAHEFQHGLPHESAPFDNCRPKGESCPSTGAISRRPPALAAPPVAVIALASLRAGLVFGLGLVVSGMDKPAGEFVRC